MYMRAPLYSTLRCDQDLMYKTARWYSTPNLDLTVELDWALGLKWGKGGTFRVEEVWWHPSLKEAYGWLLNPPEGREEV